MSICYPYFFYAPHVAPGGSFISRQVEQMLQPMAHIAGLVDLLWYRFKQLCSSNGSVRPVYKLFVLIYMTNLLKEKNTI